MLSVPEFFKGVESDNPTYDFTHHFGKMMVLYSMLGGRPGISISTNSANGFEVDIKTRSKKDATAINTIVSGTYTAYGTRYGINSVCEQKVVHLEINKL